MQLAVNARPLLGPVTGIGRYLAELMREVERDGGFAADYFYVTHWSRRLAAASSGAVSPRLVRALRSLPPLHAVGRALQRRTFSAGIARGDCRLYFEPNFVPFPSALPTVITIHDLSHLRHAETHPAARVRQLSRELPGAVARAARILTPSAFTRREVIEVFGVPEDLVVATPLGCDRRFAPREAAQTRAALDRLGLDHGRYCLAVGTLEPRKNLLTTVEAHARLPQALRAAHPLAVAGVHGWLAGPISRRLAQAQARGDVRLLGHVPDDDLPHLYAGASMLCYPSLYEGFGLPPLEAMASGVPVAVSDRASLPEVVGDAGIVLPPHDVEGFTEAMHRVFEDAAFAAGCTARGLARAAHFSWGRCAALTIACWREALGEGAPR